MNKKQKKYILFVGWLLLLCIVVGVVCFNNNRLPEMNKYISDGEDMYLKEMYVESGDTVDTIIERCYSSMDDIKAVPIPVVRNELAEINNLDGDYTVHYGCYVVVPYIK